MKKIEKTLEVTKEHVGHRVRFAPRFDERKEGILKNAFINEIGIVALVDCGGPFPEKIYFEQLQKCVDCEGEQ